MTAIRLYYDKLIISKQQGTGRARQPLQTQDVTNSLQDTNQDSQSQREYTINKKLIRERLAAWADTKLFKKTSIFSTISFPENITEQERYKILNNFLTQLRTKHKNFKHYLWVAERHKSGLIHFHMIYCGFIDIRTSNGYLATSIQNLQKSKDLEVTARYNGLDVEKIRGNVKKLASYITKYITKNNSRFNRLCWYCSKSVSNLKTYITLSDYELSELAETLEITNPETFQIHEEYFSYFAVDKDKTTPILYECRNENDKIIR